LGGRHRSGKGEGQIAAAIVKAARAHGVPLDLALALINQESRFNMNARSPVGAIGFTQLMPATARSLGVDANDPIENVWGGIKYLGIKLKAYGGNVMLALASYNAGSGNVEKYGGIPPFKETRTYIRNICNESKEC